MSGEWHRRALIERALADAGEAGHVRIVLGANRGNKSAQAFTNAAATEPRLMWEEACAATASSWCVIS